MAARLPCLLVAPFKGSTKRMSIFFGVLSIITLIVALAANARAEGVAPAPPKGKGERCVESVEFMRRHHMEMLKHQRGETVHRGVRDGRFSLKGCVNCHEVKDAGGKAVSFKDSRHFCRTCHDYAAVRIDCFECHASRPGEAEPARHSDAGAGAGAKETAALAAYLKGTAK
jgi:predicted CXXCH cytochrome family protein